MDVAPAQGRARRQGRVAPKGQSYLTPG